MEVLLIRHTRVKPDRSICYGSSDVELADTYPEDMADVKKRLPGDIAEYPARVSPLTRCQILARDLGLRDFVTDDRLREFSFGDWEMKPWAEITPGDLKGWFEDMTNYPIPGGIALREFAEGCAAFWKDLTELRVERVAVVAHTAVIHVLLAHLLNMPFEKMFTLHIDYGGISKVTVGRKRTVVDYVNR
ncbi:MAG: hypothetical protein CVV44_16050 [Spirochaetae bacterium HGW-Spirochaetae-1]|jgi:alpha-ribazole phosphatase|nr:MAG: hypothetical protein CVV44_16050 [Spirochaetae bacterium HGW-Spirochaetae-1]